MLSANDVREVKFAKAMGGYKQEEVDIFEQKQIIMTPGQLIIKRFLRNKL